ncbi:MAG TPA: hypothetical protein PLL53_03735, partial [Saprospiraceae bacterium]|nr:hypothetical protein [Saprospiraceae bacterium]
LFPNATSSATTDYPTASGTFNASAAARSGAFSASNSTYFEITFTPASGRTFTINGLSFGSRSSGAGPTGISIRSDQDSYGSELAATTAPADQAWHFYSLNFTTPVTSQAGQPITLRIYGFGGTGTGPGTSTWRVDDLSIMGCTLLASTDCGDAYWSMASGATATSNNIPFVAFSGIVHGNNNGTVSNLFPNATSSSTTDYPTASGTFNANAAIVTGGFNAATSTYFEITVTPNAGKVFEFTGISFGSRSSGAGPQALSIRTNLNNYATEVAGNAAIAQNSTWAFYSFSGLSVSSLSGQPLIIRIYAYND